MIGCLNGLYNDVEYSTDRHKNQRPQGYPFKTATGLPFRYQLKIGKNGNWNKEIFIDRRANSKGLTWSSVKLAFEHSRGFDGEVEKPKALGDIRGVSYIYPLLWTFGLIRVPEDIAEKMR